MPPFKDEHVLMIAPGSQTTLAQLGLPESYCPARLRVKTRMFHGENAGEWEPVKIREKKHKKSGPPDAIEEIQIGEDGEELLWEEDPLSDEGAVYPLQNGRITNWSCLFALLTHIHNLLSPPFHTPILLITQPCWTQHDHETLTQFFFEKFKTPAFALMDHALATIYAYSVNTATVVDVGYGKCDITAVNDFCVNDIGRGIAIPDCGGEYMTRRLHKLLEGRGFTEEMAEALKRNPICEILPPGIPLPTEDKAAADSNPTAVVATGVNGIGKVAGSANGILRGAGAATDIGGEDAAIAELEEREGVLDVASIVTSGKTSEFLAKKEREKAEKAAAKKSANEASAAARIAKLPNSQRAKVIFHYIEKRPEAELAAEAEEERIQEEARVKEAEARELREKEARELELKEKEAQERDAQAQAEAQAQAQETQAEAASTSEDVTMGESTNAVVTASEDAGSSGNANQTMEEATEQAATAVPIQPGVTGAPPTKKEERRRNKKSDFVRKEIEVGTERFRIAEDGLLEKLADAIHRCVLSVPEVNKRSELWDSIIIVGNGSKVKGFKDALIATLNAKYLISPSSATIFTSELPSNFSTPLATGANTPQPQAQPTHHGSGVNPLLLAATTASNNQLAPPGHHNSNNPNPQTPQHQIQGQQQPGPFQASALILQQQQGIQGASQSHSGHGQTPTSIKMARMAEYFPEWKEAGFEEAHFLGAQVAAKIVFIIDQGISKGFMSRTEYNDLGPQGIHEFAI